MNLDGENYAVYYTGRAIVPGSLVVSGSNGNYADDGGKLEHTGGSNYVVESIVDYAEGVVRIRYDLSSRRNAPITLTFIPGAAFSQQSYTASQEVTLQTRSLTWVFQPRPIPAPGTLIVEYRALGRWATLRDLGDGRLSGDGTGQIDYSTGTINITMAALPDVGTEIIYSWGDDQSFDIQDGTSDAPINAVELRITDTY